VPTDRQDVRGSRATVSAGRFGHQRSARPVYEDRPRQNDGGRRLLERRTEKSREY